MKLQKCNVYPSCTESIWLYTKLCLYVFEYVTLSWHILLELLLDCQNEWISRYILLVLANSLLFNLFLGPLLVSRSFDPINFGGC